MQGLEYLASKLTFASFSAKTCSFYLQLLQQYADNTIFQEFALRTEYRPNGKWECRTVIFEHNAMNNRTYPHPTFEEFKLSFREPNI